ncbi:MAG: Rossmann-like domain-containing protein [Thermoleophilia bacterium]
MIAEELRNYLVSTATEQRIADLRVGSRYTAVMLEDGNVGVAYTFRENAAADPPVLAGLQSPVGRTTMEILQYLQSDDGLERTVGLAVANALANRRGAGQHEADILHVLSVGFLDRVGMVGYFGPLVAPLEKRVRELVIFERDTARSERVLPAEEALEELPRCDVALITATALIFGDLDGLLEAAAGCREVVLVGASTPLVPAVFGPRGVTLLSGVTVTDGPGILQVVSDGGGMGAFGEGIRKVNLRP